MFLPYVSEFVVFLSLKEHTLEEVLAHIVLRVLSPIDASIAFICELNKSNLVSNIGMYGTSEEMQDHYPNLYSLDEKFPLCDGVREWSTVGVHENVIAASAMALEDAITFGLMRQGSQS